MERIEGRRDGLAERWRENWKVFAACQSFHEDLNRIRGAIKRICAQNERVEVGFLRFVEILREEKDDVIEQTLLLFRRAVIPNQGKQQNPQSRESFNPPISPTSRTACD